METSNISMGQPDYYNESGESIYIAATHMLQAKNASKKKLLIELPIGTTWNSLDKTVTLKVNTGAGENVMNEHTFRRLFKDVQLESPSIILESYGNTDIEAIGKFTCFLSCKGKVHRTYWINLELLNESKIIIKSLTSFH